MCKCNSQCNNETTLTLANGGIENELIMSFARYIGCINQAYESFRGAEDIPAAREFAKTLLAQQYSLREISQNFQQFISATSEASKWAKTLQDNLNEFIKK